MMIHVCNRFNHVFLSGHLGLIHEIMSKSTILTNVQKEIHEIMNISTVFTNVLKEVHEIMSKSTVFTKVPVDKKTHEV